MQYLHEMSGSDAIDDEINQNTKIMEEQMRLIIMREIENYQKDAKVLDADLFIEKVYRSFADALTPKHYVVLLPIDLTDTFDKEQHRCFVNDGFYQLNNEVLFNNVFMACQEVVDEMIKTLQKNEGMIVDKCNDPSGSLLYVVSLFGVENTHFERDYKASAQENQQLLTD